MTGTASRSAARWAPSGGSEDRAALRRVRDKLATELAGARAALASGLGGCAERLSVLAQGLESRGHHASSLLLDELCLAAHAVELGADATRPHDRAALETGLRALEAVMGTLGRGPGSPLGGLLAVDALRAARGAQLASANLPWQPAQWAACVGPGSPELVAVAARLRPYLQKGLLGWLRNAEDHEALALVDAVFERLGQAGQAGQGGQGGESTAVAVLALAARAWVERLDGPGAPAGVVPRRLLGGFDRELRALASGDAGRRSPRLVRTVVHALLTSPGEPLARSGTGCAREPQPGPGPGPGPRGIELLETCGLERATDLLPGGGAAALDARSAVAASLREAARDLRSDGGPDHASVLAEVVACADVLAFLGEGVARREVLVLASSLDEPDSGPRLAQFARALADGGVASEARATPGAHVADGTVPISDDDEPAAVIPAGLLSDLERARGLIDLLGEEPDAGASAPGADVIVLPPELQAVLDGHGEKEDEGPDPEPTLDAIDLATLAERARRLLADGDDEAASEVDDAGAPDVTRVPAARRGETPAIDDEVLESLTVAAGAIGQARSDLERRVAGLREGLGDISRALTGLRGQLERLAGQNAGSTAERLAATGAEVDELASLHETMRALTREAETLLARQAREHVELDRALSRSALVALASRAEAWQRAVQARAEGASVRIDGGEVRIDRSVLAGVSPVVESLLARLVDAGVIDASQAGAPVSDVAVAALLASGELHLELRGPPVELEASALADAEARLLALGGRLHRVEGDGSACILALSLPLAPALRRVLTVACAGEVLAVPLDAVEGVVSPRSDDLAFRADGTRSIFHAGRDYVFERLDLLLGLSEPASPDPDRLHVVFLRTPRGRAAVAVDTVRERSEIASRPLSPQLAATGWLAGAYLAGAERPVLVLDADSLVDALATRPDGTRSSRERLVGTA